MLLDDKTLKAKRPQTYNVTVILYDSSTKKKRVFEEEIDSSESQIGEVLTKFSIGGFSEKITNGIVWHPPQFILKVVATKTKPSPYR